jgi:processing peptidase subunit beta
MAVYHYYSFLQTSGGAVTSVTAWVSAGSRHDTAHGSARLLQRLATKGTKKRSPDQLQADLAALGNNFHTHLDREHTTFQLNVLNKDVAKAVELLGDMIANPNFDDKHVNEEKAAQVKDSSKIDVKSEMFEHLHETAFYENALGRTVLGSENAHSLSKNDVQAFHAGNYTGDRVAIAAAGGVEHAQFAELADKHFGGLSTGTGAKVAPAIFVGSDKRIRYDSMNKAHVFIGYKGNNYHSADVYPQLVMQQLLGSWDRMGLIGSDSASRLARDAAEENAMHSFSAYNKFYSDVSLFGVHFVSADNTAESATWHLMQNLVRLVHHVCDEEVERAKAQLLTTMMTKQDGVNGASQVIARQLSHYGRRVSREESIARIQNIETSDIRALADKLINDEDHVLAAKGGIYELPDYNWIRRRSYWQRY